MRLYQLRFGGIGAFRDSFTIDFEAIGQGGLFLIEGATGTGKSTIIDAIVFALYGSVAGDARGNGRLASDHLSVESGQAPFAELVFETMSGVYRIYRQHEHFRQNKRSGGAPVKDPARASLWKLASSEDLNSISEGEPLSSKPSEIGPMVEQIVGLTREQFGQTVVLPQGEFARFLTAKPEERGDLLQRLFGTEIYAKIASELDSRRQQHEKAFEQADRDIAAQVNAWVGATSNSEIAAELLSLISQGDELRERLDAEHRLLQERAEQCENEFESADTARVAAEAEVQRLEAQQQRIIARRELDERAARHQLRVVAADEARATVQRITNSQVPLARHVDLQMAVTDEATTERQLADVLAQHTDFADLALPEVRDIRQGLADDIVRLTPLIEVEISLAARVEELQRLEQARSELEFETSQLERERQKLPARVVELETELVAARALAAKLELLKKHCDSVRIRRDAAGQAVEIQASIEGLEAAFAAVAKELELLETLATTVRRRYRLSTAAYLAGDLVDGEPCAVCGSTAHPQPALSTVDTTSLADVEAAESKEKSVREKFDDEHKRLARARDQLIFQRERAAGSLDEVERELQAAVRDVDEARTAAEGVVVLVDQLAQARSEIERVAHRHTEVERKLVEITARVELKRQELIVESSHVSAECAEFESVEARVRDLEQRRSVCDDVVAAIEQHDERQRATAHCRDQFERALRAADLTDDAAFNEVLTASVNLDLLRALVADFDAESAKISELMPTLVDVDLEVSLDVEGASKVVADARTTAQQASEVLTQARTAAALSGQYRTEVADALAQSQSLRESSGTERALARLINGDNPQKQTLPLYALRQQFNEVVSAANERLRVMLGGRLLLEDHHESERNFRKLGVGLRVIDRNTGTTRETSTLSGGESFCCSLALALGLADVVSAGQGGLRTETLFIDEGFGSLDQDTLDDVRAELARLRSGGRMVGVVSHVTEMKDAISHQIHVRRVAGGHSILEVDFP